MTDQQIEHTKPPLPDDSAAVHRTQIRSLHPTFDQLDDQMTGCFDGMNARRLLEYFAPKT